MAQINGTPDADLLVGQNGDDTIRGLAGNDTIQAVSTTDDPALAGSDVVFGNLGADQIVLTGAGTNNSAFGGFGRDIFFFGPGEDTVFGGEGGDEFIWTSGVGVRDLDTGVDEIFGGPGDDFLSANFSLVDNISELAITGVINGLRSIEADGQDVMNFRSIEGMDFQVPSGTNLIGFQGDLAQEFVQASQGEHRAIFLRGGDDIFDLTLDESRDIIDMGIGTGDFVRVAYGEDVGDLRINLAVGGFRDLEKSLATFVQAELFLIQSFSSSSDRILGSAGADSIDSGSGNDTISGFRGNDVITVSVEGGFQSTADGGLGFDTIVLADGNLLGAGQTVDMRGTEGRSVTVAVDGVEVVSGTTFERINATGSDGNDRLRGLEFADTLTGGAGNDIMNGFRGPDTIISNGGFDDIQGGAGRDTFVLGNGAPGVGVMRILDFNADDTFQLVDQFLFGNTFTEGEAPQFRAGAGFSTAVGEGSQLIYNTTNGRLFLDLDGEGGEAADVIARLTFEGQAADLSINQIEIV